MGLTYLVPTRISSISLARDLDTGYHGINNLRRKYGSWGSGIEIPPLSSGNSLASLTMPAANNAESQLSKQ